MLISEYDHNIEHEKQAILLAAENSLISLSIECSDLDTYKIRYLEQLNQKLNVCEFIGDEADFWDFCDKHILDLSVKLDKLLENALSKR